MKVKFELFEQEQQSILLDGIHSNRIEISLVGSLVIMEESNWIFCQEEYQESIQVEATKYPNAAVFLIAMKNSQNIMFPSQKEMIFEFSENWFNEWQKKLKEEGCLKNEESLSKIIIPVIVKDYEEKRVVGNFFSYLSESRFPLY